MVANSKCDEDDTQSRQPISKRFSKAVNVVPRSRFFKPRPNVPSSKRPESNITKVVSFQSGYDSQRTESTDNVSASLLSEKSVFPSASIESSDIVKSNLCKLNTAATINTIESPLRGLFQTSEKENEINLIIKHNSGKNDSETTNTISSETHTRYNVQTTESIEIKLPTSESTNQSEITDQKSDNSDKVENIAQNLNKGNVHCAIREEIEVKVSKEESSKPANTESSETRTGCNLQRAESTDDVAIVTNSLLSEKNLPTSTFTEPSKSVQSKPDKLNSEIVQSSLDKENIPQAIEKVNEVNAAIPKQDSCKSSSKTPNIESPEARKRSLQVEGRTETPHNVPNNITDKVSKYPHLTSILSKKRAEPKRDVTYRKRKKYKKGDTMPERSKMTIADLIYWNPVGADSSGAELKSGTISSQNYDNPVESIDDEPEEVIEEVQEEEEVCNTVPKLIISEDGQINIDQVSLVVSRKKLPEPTITTESNEETTYSSYRRRPMTKQWSAKDTTIFYKALSVVGTDFGLMEKLFPHRTRRELKLKFKREERFNIELVNRAMYESQLTFDADTLEEHIENLNALCADMESMRENKQPSVRGRKPGKKSKTSAEKKKKTNEQPDSPENHTEGVKGIVSKKRKRAKCDKLVSSELSDELQELIEHQVADECAVNFKRQRKAKKLPDDFISTDDLDEIYLDSNQDDDDEMECTNEGETCSSVIISGEVYDATIINSGEAENAVIINGDAVDNADLNENYLNSDYEQDCVAIDITGMVDVDSINNVMANEIVTSEVKRKNNKSYKLSKFQSKQAVLKPSSTNYTPADELRQIPLKFNSPLNLKTYSKSSRSNTLITSLQAPFLSPDHSSAQTLLTRLSMSDSQPIAIPVIQEGESASNPIMILSPSQFNGNTIDLYMYNTPRE